MNDLKANYDHLSKTLLSLQGQLDDVSTQIGSIENKDQAIRTYAGLPEIDKDIRELGVGGTNIDNKKISMDNISSDITTRISEIEMNVDAMTRKVKLELNSYNNLYEMSNHNNIIQIMLMVSRYKLYNSNHQLYLFHYNIIKKFIFILFHISF